MSTIHLLNYNNYYNRIIKREDSLSGYQGYQVKYNSQATDPNGNTAIIEGVNFVDRDYVDTSLVVNWGGDLPNYLLVVENNIISSRWFVVNTQKTRGGQLQLTLHRDLIADYYNNLMSPDSPIFVEKATVPSSNDLIFNSEAMTFNQIKTSETLLKDSSECPWIVLYAARNTGEGQPTTFKSSFSTRYPYINIDQAELDELKAGAGVSVYRATSAQVSLIGGFDFFPPSLLNALTFSTESAPELIYRQPLNIQTGTSLRDDALAIVTPIYEDIVRSIYNMAEAYVSKYDAAAYNEIFQREGKIFKFTPTSGAPEYYRLTVGHIVNNVPQQPDTYNGILMTTLSTLKDVFKDPSSAQIGEDLNIEVFYRDEGIYYSLEKLPGYTETTIVDNEVEIKGQRYHLVDAPYDMFCLPLSDKLIIKNSIMTGFTQITSDLYVNLAVANQLIADYSGAGQIYDAQIVPYCPIRSAIISKDQGGNIVFDLYDNNNDAYDRIISSDNITKGYIFHCINSTFKFDIPLTDPIVIEDYKVESECDIYRLCSPNYNGIFEFNAAKNGGISNVNVLCTYKPYTPYIKLYPTWGRLYGSNFGEGNFDARGLICGGDFSLPATTSTWSTYELQNKNYQNSFDRQIQNIEIKNSVQREGEIWNIASGALGAAVQGASTGGAGGAAGAIAGGIIGAGLSVAGGLRDLYLSDSLRNEAIDYSKDQFGYQLGNIKALPQSLSKVSAYNVDNKYFPFLEFYTCSDVEKQALRDKIKYNGMTVMAIGTLEYYKDNYQGDDPMYFKGKLIRLNNFAGDYHILNAIASELNKGVFI